MNNETLEFPLKIKYEDLEKVVANLSQQVFDLIIQNKKLEEKITHLESLLKNAPVTQIGKRL